MRASSATGRTSSQLQINALVGFAVADFCEQNTAGRYISDGRRWAAVGLLLGGLLIGFVGNVPSLYA